jgi:hypothetical protein
MVDDDNERREIDNNKTKTNNPSPSPVLKKF